MIYELLTNLKYILFFVFYITMWFHLAIPPKLPHFKLTGFVYFVFDVHKETQHGGQQALLLTSILDVLLQRDTDVLYKHETNRQRCFSLLIACIA